MLSSIIQSLRKHKASNKLIFILIITAISLSIATYYEITKETSVLGPDPSKVIGLVLSDLVVFMALGVLLARKFFKGAGGAGSEDGVKSPKNLQNRIILTFSLVATIPTIIVAVFSAYFFNFGIQSWFDKKISKVLDQSVSVAESYIAEHTLQLRETAISVADDLSEMYYELMRNPLLFTKLLNAQAEMRALDEAIVFQRTTNTVLAQTTLSFSLAFISIPAHLWEKAGRGEVVEVKSDQTKIRMLIKLREYNDTYLLIGRLIDGKIIDHIDKTHGAAEEYNRLKRSISSMQIRFSMVFLFVALLLLLAAISWGAVFASTIVSPIRKLVFATEKVKDGDLTIQVPEENLTDDEIKVLSLAFNRMIRQINHQRRDLVIAQRALAWSDVARRVAHEIKNPLTPIQLSAERLLKKFESEVSDKEIFRRYTHNIIRHATDIKKIVAEFVNFARLPQPTFSRCELVSVVKDIVEGRRLINEKISYSFTANEERIDFVGDVTQLNQVMINLLKNSEEALENIQAQPKIKVTINLQDDLVIIIVADNGRGFAVDLIDKATEAYITSRSKGTGLGLAIVKKIVQDHLGRIEIANRPAGGAIIKLIFELKELKNKLK